MAATARIDRRRFLAAAALIGAPGALLPRPLLADDEVRGLLASAPTVDLHSHAGAVIRLRANDTRAPFVPLADPMRSGGMAVACLAIVADSPTIRVEDKGIRAFRDPRPGELSAFAEQAFQRLQTLVREQGLSVVKTAAELRAARSSKPSVLVTSEGADFLEGNIAALERAYDYKDLRQLQLVHYRVNELGDIQTEPPVHGGLTPFGVEVIRKAQQLGIVVDLAHAPIELVKQAVAVATKPMILSHTSLTASPGPRSRQISAEHARLIASTGGVIGVWPPTGIFSNLEALAEGMARMADVAGVDHVGLGTDMLGLPGGAALSTYAQLPDLARELLKKFSRDETLAILGGNYVRVAGACLG